MAPVTAKCEAEALAMNPDQTETTLPQFLRQEWQILLGIKSRLTLCLAFEKELNDVTRGEPFLIHNDRFWHYTSFCQRSASRRCGRISVDCLAWRKFRQTEPNTKRSSRRSSPGSYP
jgi:hypothetical protein